MYQQTAKRNKTRNTFIAVTIHFDDYSINIMKFLALKRASQIYFNLDLLTMIILRNDHYIFRIFWTNIIYLVGRSGFLECSPRSLDLESIIFPLSLSAKLCETTVSMIRKSGITNAFHNVALINLILLFTIIIEENFEKFAFFSVQIQIKN